MGFCLFVIMLFSVSGVSLYKMTCTMSGNSFVYVGEMDEPCCDEQPANSISEKCCDISLAAIQITEFERSNGFSIELMPVVAQIFMAFRNVQDAYTLRIVPFAEPPPLKPSKVQALLQVFRI